MGSYEDMQTKLFHRTIEIILPVCRPASLVAKELTGLFDEIPPCELRPVLTAELHRIDLLKTGKVWRCSVDSENAILCDCRK
jgi:hypothetical protein